LAEPHIADANVSFWFIARRLRQNVKRIDPAQTALAPRLVSRPVPHRPAAQRRCAVHSQPLWHRSAPHMQNRIVCARSRQRLKPRPHAPSRRSGVTLRPSVDHAQ